MTINKELLDTIQEQEATIQKLKARLPYWADTLETFIRDSDEFKYAIQEMRQTASEL